MKGRVEMTDYEKYLEAAKNEIFVINFHQQGSPVGYFQSDLGQQHLAVVTRLLWVRTLTNYMPSDESEVKWYLLINLSYYFCMRLEALAKSAWQANVGGVGEGFHKVIAQDLAEIDPKLERFELDWKAEPVD